MMRMAREATDKVYQQAGIENEARPQKDSFSSDLLPVVIIATERAPPIGIKQ